MKKSKITAAELALIAAPLVAKGFFFDDAIGAAYRLFLAAGAFLKQPTITKMKVTKAK